MKCMDPVLCFTGKNRKIYRHFSLASPIIKRTHQQVFDCGTCIICRKKRARELAMRCVLHASLSTQNCFLTLTYDEKKEGYHNDFQYSDIQKFKKKLRRHCDYHFKKKIQIFNVHEYGKNGKKHYHLVVFNHDFNDKTLHTVKNGNSLYTSKTLEKLWPFGFNTIGNVTEASAMYQAQYTQKDFTNGNSNNQKKSHSKHSGIGRDYFLRHYRQILSLGYIPFAGQKFPIPRYFTKLAHKHYSHFFEPINFFDTPDRKALYRPFTNTDPNQEIAELYRRYNEEKKIQLEQAKLEWEQSIEPFILTKTKPDFRIAAENFLYDLEKRKHHKQNF